MDDIERRNRDLLLEIADKIENGDQLDDLERNFVAAVCRNTALDRETFVRPRKNAKRDKFPDGTWHDFLELRLRISKTRAMAYLCKKYGRDEKDLRDYLNENRVFIEQAEKVYGNYFLPAKPGRPRNPRKQRPKKGGKKKS